MLTIRAAKNPGYYEQQEFARDDYYTERGQVPGRWVGSSAETLGLTEPIQRGQLGTLLQGRSPETGEKLPGGRGRPPSNAGFDLTFTAPKSVSVLLAVGDDRLRQAILDAQDKAAMAGLHYLERHECFARRGTDGVNVIPAEGFVGGAFVHEMSRSGDPHLHTHVVIANRVLAPNDGRWTAPDMRPVYSAAKTAGTIAEAVLRDELTRSLGVRWAEVKNGTAELNGVPQGVLEHFSQRHTEILEVAVTRGLTTQRGIAEIQRETRDKKPTLDREIAQARWRARAAEHGLGKAELARVVGKQPEQRPDGFEKKLAEHLAGPDGLTLEESTFTRRQLARAIAEAHQDGIASLDLANAADAFLADQAIPVSPRVGHEPARYTTLDMVAAEARLLDVATTNPRKAITVPKAVTERVIKQRGKKLGTDQADAVRSLTSGKERTRLLEAPAGYGKTTTLRAVREAYEIQGVPVIGVAWQGQAARELQRGAGITSHTVARLLGQIERGATPIPQRAVVVIDEASMIPTRPFEKLAQEINRVGGRIIPVGDRGQLPSIDAGGAFASLADRLGVARLEENRRQRVELQIAVAKHLSHGQADQALKLLTEGGGFTTYNDSRWARASLISDWAETSLRTPEKALILAHDRREVAELNKLARAVRDHEGLLGTSRLNAFGLEWATGDRLTCRLNDYRPSVDVRNGTRGTVTKVDPVRSTLTVRTDDGRSIRLPAAYLRHVEHGYASTGHTSQGMTVDRTYLLATPERGGREWGYVAGSRHRIDLRVYAVHHDRTNASLELARTWQRSQAKTLAIDRMTQQNREMALERTTTTKPLPGPTKRVLERDAATKKQTPRQDQPSTPKPSPREPQAPKKQSREPSPPKDSAEKARDERHRLQYERDRKRRQNRRRRRRGL